MEEKPLLLLKTALRLFVERGFHHTPTALIAKEAGVANGTLFHYFATKEALIRSLYLEIKDRYFIELTENYEKTADFLTRLRHLYEKSIDWSLTNSQESQFLVQFHHSPFKTSLTEEEHLRHAAFFLELIREGQGKGLLQSLEPGLLLHLALFHLLGIAEYFRSYPELRTDERLMDKLFQSFFRSLGTG